MTLLTGYGGLDGTYLSGRNLDGFFGTSLEGEARGDISDFLLCTYLAAVRAILSVSESAIVSECVSASAAWRRGLISNAVWVGVWTSDARQEQVATPREPLTAMRLYPASRTKYKIIGMDSAKVSTALKCE